MEITFNGVRHKDLVFHPLSRERPKSVGVNKLKIFNFASMPGSYFYLQSRITLGILCI